MSENNIKEVIEGKIIDSINFDVEGRLVIVKTEKNIFGADLSIARRGKYKERPIFLQVNGFIGPDEKNIFIKDFSEKDFTADKNLYLVFVYFDRVSQKISDYIWLVPSERFFDLAKIAESPSGEKLLRFEVDLDIKNKNEYSKFLVKTNELGKLILASLEDKTIIKFVRTGFGEKIPVNFESLTNFLYEARMSTFAANANPDTNPRLQSSIQLEFQRGDYLYTDIYFSGDKNFIGQEIIYLGDKAVWGMNYMGNHIDRIEDDFLREALSKLVEKCRVGKSCEYKKREYKYLDNGQGSFEDFNGKEEIMRDNKSVYQLSYRGGIISSKL